MTKILIASFYLWTMLACMPAYGALSSTDRADIPAQNILTNSGYENGKAGWTASGGTFLTVTSGTNLLIGSVSATWDSSGAAQTFTSAAITIPEGLKGRSGEISCLIKTPSGTATHTISGWDGSAVQGNTVAVGSTSSASISSSTLIFPSSGTIAVRLTSVAADEPLIAIDSCYIGENRNIGNAQIGTDVLAFTPTGSWVSNTTYLGLYWRVMDQLHFRIRLNLIGAPTSTALTITPIPSTLTIDTAKLLSTATNGSVPIARGTARSAGGTYEITAYYNGSTIAPVALGAGSTYTTNSANLSQVIPATFANGDSVELIGQVPIVGWGGSQQVVSANTVKAPTIQNLTSGTTYTRPNGVTYLKVKMVGAGGGGAGSGVSNGAGGAGGNTTFGSSLLTANGGSAGATVTGGSGGTATIAAPAFGTAYTGNPGGSGGQGTATSGYLAGGNGGVSVFGGGGKGGGAGIAGVAATTNSGSGGGGGGTNTAAANNNAGPGGGAGGWLEAYIVNPSPTYTYAIGTAGTAGTAGTGGTAGALGGAGYIEVTEYYGFNAPIIIGSVTSNASGAERTERARLTNNGSTCVITTQSGTWLSACVRNSAGDVTATIVSGMFSLLPTCHATPTSGSSNDTVRFGTQTTTSLQIQTAAGGTPSDANLDLTCTGPR